MSGGSMWKSALWKLQPAPPSPLTLLGAEQTLRQSTQPTLLRLKMLVRLSKILGRDLASSRGRRRVIDTRTRSTIKGRQVRLMKKMRSALGKKSKPKKRKTPKSELWGKVSMEIPLRPSWDLMEEEPIEVSRC
ncbi:uncharacterized protein [Cherax quadricarinatus]|uniref:uncharacterized protein n=1 Tax=Cherax quadricarinatus TaxID=27406 RepID=UPI00387ED2FD